MKNILALLLALPALAANLWVAEFTTPAHTVAATITIDADSGFATTTVASPYDGSAVSWDPPGAPLGWYTYLLNTASPTFVAPADMPEPGSLFTQIKLWQTGLINGVPAMWQEDFSTDFRDPSSPDIPEPIHAAAFGLGLLAFAARRRLRFLLPVLAFCTAALAQQVEVVSGTQSVKTRTYLVSATPVYKLDTTGTNVVLVSLAMESVTEQQIGAGEWHKLGTELKLYTREGVRGWVDSYTNASGVVVTNTVKTGFLADFTRLDTLPARYSQFVRLPQATVPPAPPEPVEPPAP